ncbi:uncharacterized protein LAESUDRAFT_709032 [Laetiporus sulphureus 93-53]|uniref:RlpA-like protein double-psi beta-barrel domain-containing protein n=1 Tax=Laetiporus sulphureus 93-53 TaxID=1314785 RepID=A0A165B6F3_9APHY|nr:uncharacterized protein LAESUDRAFT_709032 [Laetiporus sulphureus 93-53]KZT00348.1 hypothetical protein LAESUDRAFT_709032 [Laetiporus sulphureus 93-53]
MQFSMIAKFALLSLAASFAHGTPLASGEGQLERRQSYSNARMTWYNADGTGSCGNTVTNSEYIVALDSALYDSGAHCGKSITIEYDGKTAQATIADECPGCPSGGLDLTESLFEHFASLDVGVIYGDWYYN